MGKLVGQFLELPSLAFGHRAAHGEKNSDITTLTNYARVALARQIVQNIIGNEPTLNVITLDASLEHLLLQSLQQAQKVGADAASYIEPQLAERLNKALIEATKKLDSAGMPQVLLVAAPIRAMLVKFTRFSLPDMHVLGYNEIPDNKEIAIQASVGGELHKK